MDEQTPRDDENNVDPLSEIPIEPEETPGEPEGIPVPPVEPMAERPVPTGPPTPQEEVIAEQPSLESLPPPPPPAFPSYGTPEYEGTLPPPPPPPPQGYYGTEYGAPTAPRRTGPNWVMILGIVLGICLLLACLTVVVLVLLAPSITDALQNVIETIEASQTPD